MKNTFLKCIGVGIVLSITGCAVHIPIGNFPVPKSIIREDVEVVDTTIISSKPIREKVEIELLNTPNKENPYLIISAQKRVKKKDIYKVTLRYTYSIKPLGWAILLPSAALLSGTGIYEYNKGYVVLGRDLIGITILGGALVSSLIQPVVKFQPASKIRPEELRSLSGDMRISINGRSQEVGIWRGAVKIAANELFKEIPRKGQQLILTATLASTPSISQRFTISASQVEGIRQVLLEEKREKERREAERQRQLARYRRVNPKSLAFRVPRDYLGKYVTFEGILTKYIGNFGDFYIWLRISNVLCKIHLATYGKQNPRCDPWSFRKIRVYGYVTESIMAFFPVYVVDIHEIELAK